MKKRDLKEALQAACKRAAGETPPRPALALKRYRMASKVEQVAFAESLADAVAVEFAVQPRTVMTGALQQSFPQ